MADTATPNARVLPPVAAFLTPDAYTVANLVGRHVLADTDDDGEHEGIVLRLVGDFTGLGPVGVVLFTSRGTFVRRFPTSILVFDTKPLVGPHYTGAGSFPLRRSEVILDDDVVLEGGAHDFWTDDPDELPRCVRCDCKLASATSTWPCWFPVPRIGDAP